MPTATSTPRGADFYHQLFAAAREAGIEVFVNLYHFDMPAYLFRRGGWESREVVEAYASYARAAFAEFGQEIEHWFTFNEPIVEPEQRYEHGAWYPFVRDFARARCVQYGISLAHSLAVGAFRELQASGVVRPDAKIGLINCFAPPYTREDPSEADLEAVRMTDGLCNRWWLDLVTKGTLPADVIDTLAERGVVLPARPGDEAILAQGVVDWLGFNYYQPTRVQAPAHDVDEYGNPCFADPYVWPDAVMNKSRGWEIYPKGIYDFAMTMTRDYPELEWFVSENGIGIEEDRAERTADGAIDDAAYRVPFVRDHLRWIAQAIDEGAKCRGYHYWGVIDCWSWNNAYKNRYGFVEVDLTHDYERRLKASASWLRKVATHTIATRGGGLGQATASTAGHPRNQRGCDRKKECRHPGVRRKGREERKNHGRRKGTGVLGQVRRDLGKDRLGGAPAVAARRVCHHHAALHRCGHRRAHQQRGVPAVFER